MEVLFCKPYKFYWYSLPISAASMDHYGEDEANSAHYLLSCQGSKVETRKVPSFEDERRSGNDARSGADRKDLIEGAKVLLYEIQLLTIL